MKEIVRYAIVDDTGIVMACSAREEDAVYSRCNRAGCSIVKLVGQMPEPKKPRLMAPAMMLVCHQVSVSVAIFSSEKEARDTLKDLFFSWPAVPNADGYYEVEVK